MKQIVQIQAGTEMATYKYKETWKEHRKGGMPTVFTVCRDPVLFIVFRPLQNGFSRQKETSFGYLRKLDSILKLIKAAYTKL